MNPPVFRSRSAPAQPLTTRSPRLGRLLAASLLTTTLWATVNTAGCGGAASSSRRRKPVIDLALLELSAQPGADGTGSILLRFNRPVVADDQLGVALDRLPVRTQPQFSARGSWTDRQTLRLSPTEPLAPATRYSLQLLGELATARWTGELAFVNRPLRLERLSGVDLRQAAPRPTLRLHFNQAVDPERAAAGCRLVSIEGPDGRPVGLRPAYGRLSSAAIVDLTVTRPLTQGATYSLDCARIVAHAGAAPMAQPFSRLLATYGPFRLVARTPAPSASTAMAAEVERVYPDKLELALEFSNPVPLPQLKQALRIIPAAAGLHAGWLDRGGTRYKVQLDLAPQTRYEVQLDASLADVHGQKLSRPVRFALVTGHASPALSLETGIYALESTQRGYPVWSRNLDTVDVTCAAVPPRRIVQLLTSALDYDPWYEASSRQVEWKKLRLARREHRLKLTSPGDGGAKNNEWQLSRLALGRLCSPTAAGDDRRGLFLAELRSDQLVPHPQRRWAFRPRRRVLANVTDLGLLLKAGRASGLLWVTRLSTGDPVGGARVTVYRPDGKRVHRGTSDPRGIVVLPGTATLAAAQPNEQDDAYAPGRRQRLIAIVEHDGDLAVVDGNWANGIQLWNFGVPVDRRGAAARLRAFIQSDRGIYRPGETAHFKGLVREVSAGRPPRLPRTRRINVQVLDSKDNEIWRRQLTLSAFGSFALDLPIDAGAPTGDYTLIAQIGGQTSGSGGHSRPQTFREQFMVEAFRPVSFELTSSNLARHQRLGEKTAVAFRARYLFGAPVSDAQVRWRVQRRPHLLSFPRFVGYAFADQAALGRYVWWRDPQDYRPLTNVADGVARTDDGGAFSVDLADTHDRLTGAHDYLLHAAVTDQTDQTVSKQLVVTAHSSEHYLGLHSQEWVQAVGMPFAVNTVAVTPDGKQLAASAQLSLVRQRYVCKAEGQYRGDRRCNTEHELVWRRPVTIPATGNGTERILPTAPGEYVIRLDGVDGRGNKLAASRFVWVLGKGEAFWSGDESSRMSVIASKQVYAPGEVARLVPRATLRRPTALVTLERDGVIEAHVFKLESTAEGLHLPIVLGHAPNIYASVALVSGRHGEGDAQRPQFKLGVVELKVKSAAQRVEVEVRTDRDSYEPGQRVQGTIRVSSQGKPVRAEVALSAADEGVLQLIAYRTPDPFETMYRSWRLGVDSSTTWNRLARLNDPNGDDPEQGGDGGGSGADRVRSRFVSSAYWAPALVTDASGSVRFSFVAPDNLTAFRLMAVAADRGSRFGAGESRFTLRKPLLARPIAPRFLRAGDRLRFGVLVRNDSGRGGTVAVSVRADGLAVARPSREVRLRDGASRRVLFEAKVLPRKRATVRFAVALGEHRDRVALTLPIQQPRVVEQRLLAGGELAQGSAAVVALDWDGRTLTDESSLTLSIDRTGLSELEGALSYLVGYPYGCLEQTLSRFIPLVKARDLVQSLELEQLPRRAIDRFVAAGVAKVIRHQHSDGLFGLWPGANSQPHLTVYALWGLDEARRAGVEVRTDVLARGVRALDVWLQGQRLNRSLGEGGTVAMAAYLLARIDRPRIALNARLFELHRALPSYGLAFLLRAMVLAKAPAAQLAVLERALLERVRVSAGVATVHDSLPELERYMSSDVRSAAMVLSALLALRPSSPARDTLIAQLVAGLRAAQGSTGRWKNTQDNLYALVALADYARHETRGRSQVELHWTPKAGSKRRARRLLRRTVRGASVVSQRWPLSGLEPGTLTLKGKGRLRYQLRLTTKQPDRASGPLRRGLGIVREYLDPQTHETVTQLKAGQLVKVRLTIDSAEERHYVAVVDPLPAGLEALNPKLATSRIVDPPNRSSSAAAPRRRGWPWNHTELRDDRVLAFADALTAGQDHVFEYLARATIRGQFYASPARVEQMYHPERHGRSSRHLVVISEPARPRASRATPKESTGGRTR